MLIISHYVLSKFNLNFSLRIPAILAHEGNTDNYAHSRIYYNVIVLPLVRQYLLV